jgi:hypothetical protein
MSVKEAKKILIEDADDMTDDDVANLVDDAEKLARILLDIYIEKKLKDSKNIDVS